ncbi:NtaA/DmoA family FMN-dependent monooxygenase [Nocardioides sp. BP30]|uniref:NtaA/DmoA family FMN-dependent monooxygenase n=1 Tax=Nocardioides sp. BP30 TaxID=3036374 RepID=UPI0024688290|nr:NtaA/DmoA family FMN-dependent monooxygenase [Nocardioides sp. BP30]WGL53973.1 NtaA/DmoA family FMN-dependent monooxygenase [Nocardioides sp. BP30]
MKPIILGAFEINQVNLTSQGMWAHPEQTTHRYTDLDHWVDLAVLLERGGFDFMFVADSYGYPHMNGITRPVVIEQAVEVPNNDPMMLVSAMAAVTERLAFVVTASTTHEHPYANARRFATLDHLTKGRAGWNMVTTSMEVVSELFGTTPVPHDERYARAQDFVDLSYKLLEGSWDDDAVLVDKQRRIYADPAKVREVHHEGPYFTCHGYFDSEPSRQRTPVLFQAGASETGRSFGARNAEVVFLHGRNAQMLREQVDDVRVRTVREGRGEGSVRTVAGLSVLTASSRAEAERRLDAYLDYVDPAAARAYFGAMTGIDLEELDPDMAMADLTTDGSQTQVHRYRHEKVREATADFIRHGMRELILLGTPTQVADQMGELVESTGLDGFLYTPFVTPGSYQEFADDVAPALRAAGLLEHRQAPTFRQALFPDGGPHLPASHPADRVRHVPSGTTR